jgi:CRISPR/Cas system endoribonuclease Cas6 (RAMP superfamily)
MFFVQMNLELKRRKKRPFTPIDSIYAHAAVMHAISAVDKSLGTTLHDTRRDKPLGLALLNDYLRLNWFGPTSLPFMQALMAHWQTTPAIRIGRRELSLELRGLTSSQVQQVKTWHDLTLPTKHTELAFHFMTPTAVTRQDSQRQRYTALHPDPVTIFTQLAHRWQALGGPPLADGLADYLNDGGCVTKKYDLSTVEFRHRQRTQLGFVGYITYLCRQSDADCVQTLNWLTRLAPFAGVGYQTTRGMGAVATKFTG